MSNRNLVSLNLTFIWIVFLLVSVSDADASSVRKVTLDEMVQQSEFVFEGKVLTIEATEESPRRIYTYATFEILEIIKGEYPKSTISLRFLGGTVGNATMAVSDMQFPKVGEYGIYFVESLERLQAHPLYGWSQGHFLVERDETGIERVTTNRKEPLIAVSNDTLAVQTTPGENPLQPHDKGVAGGLIVAPKGEKVNGITAQEFKDILHQQLGKIQ
jgi:hypothetical protein